MDKKNWLNENMITELQSGHKILEKMKKWSQLGFGLGDSAKLFTLHIILVGQLFRETNVPKDFKFK